MTGQWLCGRLQQFKLLLAQQQADRWLVVKLYTFWGAQAAQCEVLQLPRGPAASQQSAVSRPQRCDLGTYRCL